VRVETLDIMCQIIQRKHCHWNQNECSVRSSP